MPDDLDHQPAQTTPTDAPSDNTTLSAVIESYRAAGFVTDFYAEEDGRIRCDRCSTVIAADELRMESMRRLEGASDPADMMSVVATSCPVCGAEGTMVLGYGPNASAGDAVVARALQDRRDSALLPPDAPPGEMPDGPVDER